MDKETNKHEDQAEQLKRIFNEVQQGSVAEEENEVQTPDFTISKTDEPREIDVLNLPPRREVHGQSKNRTSLKIGKPFRRLLFVTIVLIIVIVGAYFLLAENPVLVRNSL